MYETSDFKKGLKIMVEGNPYVIVDFQHVKPGKGNQFSRTKMRALLTGQNLERTFKSGEKFEIPNVENIEMTYLYKDGMPITSDGANFATSYALLNTKFGFKRSLSVHCDLDLYFGINNITGTQYPYMVFVNQLPDAYLPAPYKANYFGGINFKYNF